MSDTIFLDPVSPKDRTIFIEVRNTSDRVNFDIKTPIKNLVAHDGYRVINDPEIAHYWLQANVRMVKKGTPEDAQSALANGYGGPLIGGTIGAGVGLAKDGKKGAVAGGLIGAGVGFVTEAVAEALVTDVLYVAVTDVQVVERAREGVAIRTQAKQHFRRGQDGNQTQTYSEVGNRKKYRTRVVSTANQANLQYPDAAPLLTNGLTRAVANLF